MHPFTGGDDVAEEAVKAGAKQKPRLTEASKAAG